MNIRTLIHRLDEQRCEVPDFEPVLAWIGVQPDREAALNETALTVAHDFVSGTLRYDAASGVMNHLMAGENFEASPTFWTIYLAFEDAETADHPESSARENVAEALTDLAT